METQHAAGIRHATSSDLDEMYEIEKRSFPGPTAYSRSQLEELFLDPNGTSLVEVHDGKIRGFIMATCWQTYLTCSVETIDVDPTFHSRGVGYKLLMAVEEEMKRKGMKQSQLEVSRGNEKALRLYKKAGYVFKEKIENYYEYDHHGTRDAIRMVKPFEPDPKSEPMNPSQASQNP